MSNSGCQTIRFAFVGCGSISRKHVIAIRRVQGAEIVGAFDTDAAAAKSFAEEHDIPAYSDMNTVISKADPDVLVVLTPSGLHGRHVLECVRFGKHFVVEKPLALRLDEVDEILQRCDEEGLRVFVVKQNRFNLPIRALKEALDKGRFGKLVMGTVCVRWRRDQAYYDQKAWRGTWALDGGVLTNQASHHIDMLLWLMGDPVSIMAKTARRLVDIEAEDTGVAILNFRSGALGIVEATTATRPKDMEGSISILGEKGTVEVGGFFMNELKTWEFEEPDEMDKDVFARFGKVPEEKAWNHTEFYRDVVESLRTGRKALVDGLEGRRSVELINAIYESVERGQEVSLRFSPKRCPLGIVQ